MDRTLIFKGRRMVSDGGSGMFTDSGGGRPHVDDDHRPPPDDLEQLKARLARVRECIEVVRKEDPNESSGSRLEWLLRNGGIA